MRRVALLLLVVPLAACVTMIPRGARPSDSAFVIESVPVAEWGDNTCGSGALAAVLNHYGDPVTEAELDAKFPKGRHGGVVTVDLLIETRRRGFDARLVRGDEAALTSRLREGRPAILMLQVLDAPGEGVDLFHYVVADGWDPQAGRIRFQFGDGKARWVPLEKLERAWEGAGYATLLVDPLTKEAALRRGVLLEEKGNDMEALEAYEGLLRRHPDSVVGWTNAANVRARLGDAAGAEAAYRRALALAPGDRDALNNLAWLLFIEGRLAEAEPLARAAAGADGPDPHFALDTLARILAATGECAEAERTWRAALASPSLDPASETAIRDGLATLPAECGAVARGASFE